MKRRSFLRALGVAAVAPAVMVQPAPDPVARIVAIDREAGALPIGASLVWPEFLDTNVFRLDTMTPAGRRLPEGDR